MAKKSTGPRTEIIRPHKFADGQDAMGTIPANVHGPVRTGYAGAAYRANLRSDPVQNNPKVTSKGARNAAQAGFKPSDLRNGQQPAKLETRDLPSGIMAKSVHPFGKVTATPADWASDGSGKWLGAQFPNSDKVGLAGVINKPGAASKPSGRTITK